MNEGQRLAPDDTTATKKSGRTIVEDRANIGVARAPFVGCRVRIIILASPVHFISAHDGAIHSVEKSSVHC